MNNLRVKLPSLAEFQLSPGAYTDPQAIFKHSASPSQEPKHAWLNLNRISYQKSLKGIRSKAEKILANATSTDIELQEYRTLLEKIEQVPELVQKNIVIVGQQGVGKSSVANALLRRHKLAETSGMGDSCSKYATKYTHLPGAGTKCAYSQATVKFMDADTIETMLASLVAHYEYFYFNEAEDEASPDDGKILANGALEVFSVAFSINGDPKSEKQLDCLLTKQNIESGHMLQVIVKKVLQRIRDFGSDASHIKILKEVSHKALPELLERVGALWPFVDLLTIATGGHLLSNGFSIFDVPGLGDINQTREAVSGKYFRMADHVFIVHKGRVETEIGVRRLLQESIRLHGVANTTLVINGIDDVMSETFISRFINDPKNNKEPIPTIRTNLQAVVDGDTPLKQEEEENLDDEENFGEEDDEDYAPITKIDSVAVEYARFLKGVAGETAIRYRERKTMRRVQEDLGISEPLRSWSVSADQYLQCITPSTEPPKWTAEQTGVPQLRQGTLELTAQENYNNLAGHLEHIVWDVLHEKMNSLLQKHEDNSSYARCRHQIKDTLANIETVLGNDIENIIVSIPLIWQYPDEKTEQLHAVEKEVEKWARWLSWATFDKVIRDNGIPTNSQSKKFDGLLVINLNYDILTILLPKLEAWKQNLLHDLSIFEPRPIKTVLTALEDINRHLEMTSGNPGLKSRAFEVFRREEKRIRTRNDKLRDEIIDSVERVFRLATAETDVGCIIAQLLAPIYKRSAKVARQSGFHARQVEELKSGLNEQDAKGCSFIEKYERAVSKRMERGLRSVLIGYQTNITYMLRGFNRTMEEFLGESKCLPFHDLYLRQQLRELQPELESDVRMLQKGLADAACQNIREEPDSSKRRKTG